MEIVIHVDDLIPEYKEKYKAGLITNLNLDYATNGLHGWLGEEDVIIFKFKNYGWIHDNKYNTYEIYADSKQIKIEIHDRRTNR